MNELIINTEFFELISDGNEAGTVDGQLREDGVFRVVAGGGFEGGGGADVGVFGDDDFVLLLESGVGLLLLVGHWMRYNLDLYKENKDKVIEGFQAAIWWDFRRFTGRLHLIG